MTALKPYLNYLKINLKTYLAVVVGVMGLILAIGFVMTYIYLESVQGGAATKAGGTSFSSMYGSLSGVAMVYGILLSTLEFNIMMNMRADRKSIIFASIISLIEFTIISMIIFSILLIGSEYIIAAISPIPLVFKRLDIIGYLSLIVIQSSVGLVLGALFYRFGGIKIIIGIMVLASIVVLFAVSPSSMIQSLGVNILLYTEIALENYEVLLTVIFTLLMYTIYWLVMRKAPIKEYSKKNLFRINK